MMGFLRRFWGLDKFVLVEVTPELPLGAEAREACARLGEHPGFQYLIQQLRRHKGAVNAALRTCSEEERVPLQQFYKALNWVEAFVNHEAKIKATQHREISLSEREQQVLQQSLANMSVVE